MFQDGGVGGTRTLQEDSVSYGALVAGYLMGQWVQVDMYKAACGRGNDTAVETENDRFFVSV